MTMWFVAYGWIILSGIMHFIVDVAAQYLRGAREPSTETTYYYAMNTAFSLGQLIFGLFGLLLLLQAPKLMTQWPVITLTFSAAILWFLYSLVFLPYKEPKFVSAAVVLLVIAAIVSNFINTHTLAK